MYKMASLFTMLTFSILTFCQERNSIFVEFEVDDEKIQVTGRFELDIVLNGKIRKLKVRGNKVVLPNIDESKYPNCDVIIKFDNYRLEFKKVATKELKWRQDVTWLFRIDNPPFYENYKGVDWEKVKRIYYWSIKPHEVGEGYEFILPVFK